MLMMHFPSSLLVNMLSVLMNRYSFLFYYCVYSLVILMFNCFLCAVLCWLYSNNPHPMCMKFRDFSPREAGSMVEQRQRLAFQQELKDCKSLVVLLWIATIFQSKCSVASKTTGLQGGKCLALQGGVAGSGLHWTVTGRQQGRTGHLIFQERLLKKRQSCRIKSTILHLRCPLQPCSHFTSCL